MDNDRQQPQSDDEEVEFIAQPGSLRDKVGIIKPGDPDPLEAADQAVADQSIGYLDRARDELAALRGAFERGMGAPADRSEALHGMFTAAHNLKGQGKSFGYDTITKIASSLCELLRDRSEMEDAGMKIVKMHIDSLAVVFEHDLRGDGGASGRKLLDRLSDLVASRAG